MTVEEWARKIAEHDCGYARGARFACSLAGRPCANLLEIVDALLSEAFTDGVRMARGNDPPAFERGVEAMRDEAERLCAAEERDHDEPDARAACMNIEQAITVAKVPPPEADK
jgi:hypothetical protein